MLARTTAVALIAAVLALPATADAVPDSKDIGAAGSPLDHITIGADLSCQVHHKGEESSSFFPRLAAPGDCGTFLAVDGSQLFAPDFRNHESTATGLGLGTDFTPWSVAGPQSQDGTRVTTGALAGDTGLAISQIDTYSKGGDAYRTDVTVKNAGNAPHDLILYRGADCFLQETDSGYGFTRPATGAVGCSAHANNRPAGRIESFLPITGGNTFYEERFSYVWDAISKRQPLANQCGACDLNADNGMAIAWSFNLAPGAETMFSHWTVISPTGRETVGPQPPPTSTTVDNTVVGVQGPRACVKPPKPARLRVTSHDKQKISRDRYGYVRRVKILRVTFYLDGRKLGTDRKSAFKWIVPTKKLAAGDHRLVADVLLRPLRQKGRQVQVGKKFKRKKVSVPLKVCA